MHESRQIIAGEYERERHVCGWLLCQLYQGKVPLSRLWNMPNDLPLTLLVPTVHGGRLKVVF